jgi:uncharacterized membrane protein YkoI
MKTPKGITAALLAGLVSTGASAATAQALDRVLPIVEQQVPGTMLDARETSSVSPKRELRYQIKWLTEDGRVVWLSVDARTGRVRP